MPGTVGRVPTPVTPVEGAPTGSSAAAAVLAHDWAGTPLGPRAAEAFAEIWALPGVGEVIERTYREGVPFLEKETTLPLLRGRSGVVEQAVFTRGYSPVRDSTGHIVGILTVAAETTHVNQQLQSL